MGAEITVNPGSSRGLFWMLALTAIVATPCSYAASPLAAAGLAVAGLLLALIAFSRPYKPLLGGTTPARHADPQVAEVYGRVLTSTGHRGKYLFGAAAAFAYNLAVIPPAPPPFDWDAEAGSEEPE